MQYARPLRVVVVGGGFAAGEALLALRAFAGDRVELELVSPNRRLTLRPQATSAAFTGDEITTFDLGELARDVGASVRHDTVRAVAPSARRVSLGSGGAVDYDALVLAIGARARVGVPGAVIFRDQRDLGRVGRVVDELRAGEVRQLVFAAPVGVTWTLPLYELALQAGERVEQQGLDASVAVVTPESAPLEVFGRTASDAVCALLRDRGVRVSTRAGARSVDRSGVRLTWGGTVPADRVIAVPVLSGHRLPGIPSNFSGFVTTDRYGRVRGADRVWAAGDMTDRPIKQGGLAVQQAEAAAADIAALSGVRDIARPQRPVLRAQLVGGEHPLYLRTALDWGGRPLASGAVVSEDPPWWPTAKVFGRHLTPWMASRSSQATVPA